MKPLSSSIRQSHGFSLIEILVSLAVMSIMMVGFLRMTSDNQDEIANMRSKLGQLVLAEDLRFQASESNLCMAGLKTKSYKVGSGPIEIEFDLGGTRQVKSGANLMATDNVMVRSFRMVNPVVVPSMSKLPQATGATSGTVISGNLEILAEGGTQGDRTLKKLTVGRINLLVDGTSTVVDCNNMDLGGRTPSSTDTADNSGSGTDPCLSSSVGAPSGSPPWANKWAQYRDSACAGFKYPMTAPQLGKVCEKQTTVWPNGMVVNTTPQPANCADLNRWNSGVVEVASMGPLGPFQSLEECKSLQKVPDGLQVASKTSVDGGTTFRSDFCINGKMISVVSGDTNTTYQPPPQTPGDGS